ncbi:hypothetical protein TNCV_1847701 [Trichonephila clavipes]|nr:hypothetical protein TNCV_1847701 [Trichonephila clavipes]
MVSEADCCAVGSGFEPRRSRNTALSVCPAFFLPRVDEALEPQLLIGRPIPRMCDGVSPFLPEAPGVRLIVVKKRNCLRRRKARGRTSEPCRDAATRVKSIRSSKPTRWRGVVVRRGGASSDVVFVT